MESDDKPTPDVYTNEWYRKQFISLNFHWQRSMAEEAGLASQVRLLRQHVAKLDEELKADMAKIGELQERLDKAADVIKEIRAKLAKKETAAA